MVFIFHQNSKLEIFFSLAGSMADTSPNDPTKMLHAAFQPTRLLSGKVVSFWWTHPNEIFTAFSGKNRCSISTTDFPRDG